MNLASSSISVIALGGELELSRRNEVREALTLDGAPAAVLLDFSDVTYADSTTLAELLRFHREASTANVRVALLVKSKQFARVIEYAGLDGAFNLFDRRSSALSYLGGAKG
jgi:anti-anti-sigma factor